MEDLSIKLRNIMNVAAEWNAIVLLDEADIFLQKRSPENYSRNERVAGKLFSASKTIDHRKSDAKSNQCFSESSNTTEVSPTQLDLST